MPSNSEIKAAIHEFLEGYSIEATPHDAANLKDFPSALPAGTRVYVAHPPGMSIDDVVDFCEKLRNVGFVPQRPGERRSCRKTPC